jgi:hypothetical protein
MIFKNVNDYNLPDIFLKTLAILSDFGEVGTLM